MKTCAWCGVTIRGGGAHCSTACGLRAFAARRRSQYRGPEHALTDEAIKARFWSKVQLGTAQECWPWRGSTNGKGYGWFYLCSDGNGRRIKVYAHRVSGVMAGKLRRLTGVDPDDLAMHSCDNPRCCNPAHLSAGTNQMNLADASARGLLSGRPRPRGEANGASRLTPNDVIEIRDLLASGVTKTAIARLKGVHRSSIRNIETGHLWSWVEQRSGVECR